VGKRIGVVKMQKNSRTKSGYSIAGIFLVILGFCYYTATGQYAGQDHITIDDGLINNEVTAIHQDAYGFIWIGTRGGLNKYNGYDFSTIRSVPGSVNNLSNQAVEVMAESGNTLWIGNKTGGLNSYDFITETIRHYTPPDSVKIQEIKSLLVDPSGRLYIGSLHGLYVLYNDHFYTIDNRLTVNALARDAQGNIWAGTVNGLYRYGGQGRQLEKMNLGPGNLTVTSLAINNQTKNLYIGSWVNGLIRYNLTDHSFVKYLSGPAPGSLPNNNTYRVLIDRDMQVWVGTWGGGLYRFREAENRFEKIVLKPVDVFSKDYDIILSILQDKSGIVFVGTDGGGVCRIDPYRKKFNAISNAGADRPLLENTHITAVFEGRDGALWLGTKGSGLQFSADRRNFIQKDLGIKTIRINTFFENERDLWVGSGDGLLVFRDYMRNSGRPQLVSSLGNKDTLSLSGPKVTAIVKDKSGLVWVGTQEHGLNRVINYVNGVPKFKRYPERVGVAGALQNNRISCMLVDKSNRLWIGTYDGLHLYNRDTDDFTVIHPGKKVPVGLSNNTILSMAEDAFGTIWIGTQQGLNSLVFAEDGSIRINSFYQSQGFPNDYIHAVLIDNGNNVWMSTNKGITKYHVQNRNFRNFDTRDGVASNTFSENAAYLKPDGQMFFGGINGLTYFYPDSIYLNHYKPQVYFTGLQINNQPVHVGEKIRGDVILSKAFFLVKELSLSYRENIISISFAALDFHAPDKNQYQYRLEGFDDKWVSSGDNRSVTYTGLPSGTYTFKVKASNSDQTWNDTITELRIYIAPPPWKTWWAYLIYFIIIAGVLWFSRHSKLKRIYLQNRLQIANLNYEKEREIAEIKSRFFTNISHEFRTPLTLMIGPLEDLVTDQQISTPVRDTVRRIQNQARRLLSLINQLLDFHKAEVNSLSLNISCIDLVAMARRIAASFEEEAARKGIRFVFNSERKELLLYADSDKLESILYNLLSNALKFTNAGGEIQLSVKYQSEPAPVCEIVVADTGKGVRAEEKEKIFDRFYQVAQAEPGKYLGTGIGLAFVKDLVELHRGTIRLEDNQPQGSVFTIALPGLAPENAAEQEMAALRLEEEETDEPDQMDEPEEEVEEPADPPILLVVEDNAELNQYICGILGKHGRVISAMNGKEGLDKALQTLPDLVVSDVMMPEMDGYTLCKMLKEDNRTSHIPVILLTAKSDDQSHVEGIQLGADSYLGKPFRPAILVSHVNNLIRSRKKLKELFAQRLHLEPSEVATASFNDEFIKNAIQYVEDNIDKDDFLIDELATQLNMSRSTFYRKLKAVTGMSGSDFIRMIRLKRSAQLLKTGKYTVSMAAYEAGFNDLKHFRKSFQKQFGVTPSEYSKQKDAE
jgi:signal transduction histidine kinase/ligand-binding sensor domain-containing protein/DNA-binding response OmpR family regulator